MAIDTVSPRTRRALLAAALGAGAATVASALGRPLPAKAADGQAMVVGGDYDSTTETSLNMTTAGGDAFSAYSPSGRGIFGQSYTHIGVYGETVDGTGIYGVSASGHGVVGQSDEGPPGTAGVFGGGFNVSGEVYGVHGQTESPSGRGVFGRSKAASGGTGAFGQADSPSGVGVRGLAWDGDAASAKFGTGVLGFAGIHSKASWPAARSNTGVMGHSPTGTGVYASSTGGYALRTSGRLKVDKASGVATIAAGNTSVPVTPGLDVTSTSFVLLTPKADPGTRRLWYTTNTTANTITIRVSSAVTADLKVGWLLLG